MKAPDRGDLISLDFDPGAGHEQAKCRPALVLSPAEFNAAFGLAIVCPVSTKPKGHAFEVALPAGLSVRGVVLTQHVKSLDWLARRARFRERAPEAVVACVREIIAEILDL
ncbi:mRNA-degrading endonuclease [bacterium]|nr:MAG: mRNA-degrading endonuclease [bacterium]